MISTEPYKIHWDYWTNYYKHCDQIAMRGGVYGMTFHPTKPNDWQQPCEFEETIYIGRSSGYYIDKQGKTKTKKRSHMHKRQTRHHKSLSAGEPQSKGFQLIKEKYGYGEKMLNGVITDMPLWLCIMIPSPSIRDEQVARWCASYEMNELLKYNLNFGRDPLGNMDCSPNKNADSFSSIRLRELKENSLQRFID